MEKIESRIRSNKHHAAYLRAKLSKGATETVKAIIGRMTDEQLIAKEREHHQRRIQQ